MATIKKVKKAQNGRIFKKNPAREQMEWANMAAKESKLKSRQYNEAKETAKMKVQKEKETYGPKPSKLKTEKERELPQSFRRYKPDIYEKMVKSGKKSMKTGGTLAPSKKSVGKTFGKLNKAKYGTSKKK